MAPLLEPTLARWYTAPSREAKLPVIDRIADKGIIHKNKAARHKSRLSAALKALA